MKVIFLDIDGVLNTSDTFKRRKKIYKKIGVLIPRLDFFRIRYLKEIVKNTEAKIVITSSWKKSKNDMRELKYIFDLFNLNIYGVTLNCIDGIRSNEIIDFLNKHNVDSFVILDDESCDLIGLEEHLVKTRNYGQTGLLKDHISVAINILNNSKKLVLNNKE